MAHEGLTRKSLLAILLFLLAGCAGLQPAERPQDFPMHATDRFFDLYWRLNRGEGEVSAVGLVEAARASQIDYVILELRGLDKEGQVVSHGFGRTYQGQLVRGDPDPFVVRLSPTGREDRFQLSVWDFGWSQGGPH